MEIVVETIPQQLKPEANAALAWLNAARGTSYKISGVVDPDETIAARDRDDGYELGLVLCQDDLCLREQIAIHRTGRTGPTDSGFDLSLVKAPASNGRRDGKLDPPAELDPAPGARDGWLDDRLSEHRFTVVLFYRGFW